MSEKIGIKDAFIQALKIEELGKSLYEKLEQKTADPLLKKIFHELSLAEDQHRISFEKMLNQIDESSRKDGQELKEKSAQEIKAFDDKIFNRMEVIKGHIDAKNAFELLDSCINVELEVIQFFTQVEHVLVPHERGLIMGIINEEKEHVKKLVRERNKFKP